MLRWIMGLGAIAPILMIVAALAMDIIGSFITDIAASKWYLENLRALIWLVAIPLTIGYIAVAVGSEAVPKGKKGLWVALLLFGSVPVLPFFWYWYVLPQDKGKQCNPSRIARGDAGTRGCL